VDASGKSSGALEDRIVSRGAPRLRAAGSRASLPPVDVQGSSRIDQTRWDGEPAATNSPKTPAFPPTRAPSTVAARARLKASVFVYMTCFIGSITKYCDATLLVLC
jgi:hypothetical protein